MEKILGHTVEDAGDVMLSTEQSTIVYEWCCDCSLRHIVIYDPVEEEGKLWLRRRLWRDDLATRLRKYYKRSKAKLKRGAKR